MCVLCFRYCYNTCCFLPAAARGFGTFRCGRLAQVRWSTSRVFRWRILRGNTIATSAACQVSVWLPVVTTCSRMLILLSQGSSSSTGGRASTGGRSSTGGRATSGGRTGECLATGCYDEKPHAYYSLTRIFVKHRWSRRRRRKQRRRQRQCRELPSAGNPGVAGHGRWAWQHA